MSKGARPVVFVCGGLVNEKVTMEMFENPTAEEACKAFETKFGARPTSTLGPFFKKRMGVREFQMNVSFSGTQAEGEFGEWNVTAHLLENPKDTAWIFFRTRIDGKKTQRPESCFVDVSEVPFLKK